MIKNKAHLSVIFPTAFLWAFFIPAQALATQGHGGIEGVYAHQFAHLFFIVSMGSLIYWLRQRGLVRESGWKHIQYSAFFFILWNIDTMTVHLLDEQFSIIRVARIGVWQIQLNDIFNSDLLKLLYYFAQLDHLFCVPAAFCLYIGLKHILKESRVDATKEGPS